MAFLGVMAIPVLVGSGLAIAWDPTITQWTRIAMTLLTLSFGWAAMAAVIRWHRGNGGILRNPRSGELGLGLTGPGDVWWIAPEDIAGLHVGRTEIHLGDEDSPFGCLLELRDRSHVLLAECENQALAEDIGAGLADALGIAVNHQPMKEPLPTMADGGLVFQVNRGLSLNTSILLLGVGFSLLGALLFLRVEQAPAVGFLLGPPLSLMGVLLLAVAVLKRLAAEHLQRRDGAWHHHYQLGSIVWGQKSVRDIDPALRLRLCGHRGAQLELATRDGVIIMGSGASTRTTLGVESLARLLPALRANPNAWAATQPSGKRQA